MSRPEEIQRCVASIAGQTLLPQQVVIVDAGDLGDVCNRLRDACESVGIEFIYCRDKPSTTRQRNLGAEYVTSDVILFLDDDVELDSNYVEEIARQYQSDTEHRIGGITGVLNPQPIAGHGIWRYFAALFLLAETKSDVGTRLKRSNFPVHSTGLTQNRTCQFMPSTAVSYRTAVFNHHLFDVDLTGYVMAEDIDLSYRISRTHQLVMSPDAVYRHSKSSVARNSMREQEKRRILFTQYFFCKNFGSSGINYLARYWALLGMALRYLYFGIRHKDMEKFLGFCDGIRSAGANGLLWQRHFSPGPLDH